MPSYHHLGYPALADAFGVRPEAVATWRRRYPTGSAHAFPAADVEIDGEPGWNPERLPESLCPPVSRGAYLEVATARGLFIDEAVRLLRELAAERPELTEPELAGWLVDRWTT